MTQVMSIKDTRDKLAEVVNHVSATGDAVVITKFGKPKVMIVPISDKKQSVSSALDESFGIWKDRRDIGDTGKWVRNLRDKMSRRHE